MRLALFGKVTLLPILFASALHAQTVSPVIAECPRKCSGSFTVTNNGIEPMPTIIDLYSVSFANGKPVNAPLTASEHVRLSETSARIPPKGAHEFDYRITCDVLPCQIGIAANMGHGHTSDGLAVRLVIITAVYVCEKSKGCRDNVRHAAGL